MILIDRDMVTVESFESLKHISTDCIVIQCRFMLLTIYGKDLVVSAMNRYEITIRGKIGGLQFDESNA